MDEVDKMVRGVAYNIGMGNDELVMQKIKYLILYLFDTHVIRTF